MRVPRFSLLTLLLGTMLIASGTALWLHWPAWRVDARIDGALGPFHNTVSPDRRMILVTERINHYAIYDMYGTVLQRIPDSLENGWVRFSNDGTHIVFTRFREEKSADQEFVERSWSIAKQSWEEGTPKPARFTEDDEETTLPEGRWVLAKFDKPFSHKPIRFRLFDAVSRNEVKRWDDCRVVFDASVSKTEALIVVTNDRCERLELPALNCTTSIKLWGPTELSPDCRWIACEKKFPDNNSIVIHNLQTGRVAFEISPPRTDEACYAFSPDSEMFCVFDTKLSFVQLWNTETWTKKDLEVVKNATEDGAIFIDLRFLQHSCIVARAGRLNGLNDVWVWDIKNGALVYSGKEFQRTRDNEPFRIISDEYQIFEPPARESIAQLPPIMSCEFLADRERILAIRSTSAGYEILILARHRPEQWWGIAWLPEFWSTVVFAVLFVWNLRRARFSR